MATTTETPRWTLGDRLGKARDHAGISKAEMAERLGVSERTIRNYENESVHVTRLIALAYAAETDVPVDWLMGGDARSTCFSHPDGIDQLELFANGHALVGI